MNVALPWIIAFFFMIMTVIFGVNWAFDAYEKTRLQNEEHKIFIRNLGINENLAIRLQRCKRTTHTHTRFRNEFTT